MEKYKICPVCGKHNPPDMWECVECETDLISVRAVDSETENNAEQPETQSNEARLVRVCDCGTNNPPAARKCLQCGEDISDIIPTPENEEQIHFVLASTDGAYAYEITETPVIIGREQQMQEYLSRKTYVSRRHAELKIEDGKLYITNLSGTNFTFVNNEKIDNQPHQLNNGDEVSLGGCIVNGSAQENAAYFVLKTGESCS